jgi:nucleoside-diphosphate-sugar epimerase
MERGEKGLNMADCLVTGGAGFIGSNLVRALVADGRRVRVLDNLSSGRRANLEGLADVEFVEGDIRDEAAVHAAVRGARHVFHLAACPSVPESVDDPAGTSAVNLTGTLNLLVAARDARVERFVFSSSCALYGDSPDLPKREDMLPAPLSPYAVQKLAGEVYGRVFSRLYGLPVVLLRYFNVFGPRQNPASHYAAVVPRFATAALRGEPPVICGDGLQTRDFVFVDDVVRANRLACEAPPEAFGEVVNIAGGRRITILELARRILRIAGAGVAPRHEPARAGEVRDSEADIGRAAALLNWRPRTDLDEGLRRTVEWFAHGRTRA